MFPNSYPMSYGSKVDFMYDSEMENPWNLLSGHVDVAFVVVYLLPLLIFALSYNLLSVEREQGTLRMLLSQPLNLTTLLLGKVTVRAGALLIFVVLVPLLGLLVARPEVRDVASLLNLSCWALLVTAYSLWRQLCGQCPHPRGILGSAGASAASHSQFGSAVVESSAVSDATRYHNTLDHY
jgi:ABC-2 type transport system permease protein